MFTQAWRLICRITLILGILFTFFVAVEMLRVFLLLYRLNHIVGWAYAAALLLGIAVAARMFIRSWYAFPRVLTPPVLPEDLQDADLKTLKSYGAYLCRYLERLARNPQFEEEDREAALEAVDEILDLQARRPGAKELAEVIRATEKEVLEPLLGRIRETASREIRRSVRDVMTGVTLSPYHSVDLLIVLYRNGAMILRIVRLFESRPAPREQWLILRDTLRVVATVNLLNVGKNLFENLFTQIPVVGRSIDDIGQGIGAGLLTSASGYAAIDRCAAYRGWDKQRASRTIASQASRFLMDVKDLFTKDVLPAMRGRIRSTTAPEQIQEPGFWDQINRGIAASFDTTAKTVDTLLVKPTMFGTRTVAGAGNFVTRNMARAGNSAARATRHSGRQTYHGTLRVLRTFGQRIRYGMFGGPRNKY